MCSIAEILSKTAKKFGWSRDSAAEREAAVVVYKPGHTINNKMVNKLMKILEEEEQELIENRSVVIV